jgi:hypothetical protein
MPDPLEDLTAAGVSIWLDDLSRQLLTTGALHRLVEDRHVVGITSNPTIFANAIGGSADYTDQIRELGQRGTPTAEVLRLLTVADVREACDVLRPVYDATGSVDGRVSIEVDPASPMTPLRRSPRHGSCGGSSTAPTYSSKSRPPRPVCPPSHSVWRKGSASTSP